MSRLKEIDLSGLKALLMGVINRPLILVIAGVLMIAVAAISLFGSSAGARDSELALEQGRRAVGQLSETVEALQRLLQDEQVQALAILSMREDQNTDDLEAYLQGRVKTIEEVRLLATDFILQDPEALGENAFIVMDMLMTAEEDGLAPVQLVKTGDQYKLAGAVALVEEEEVSGYLLTIGSAEGILGSFEYPLPKAGYIALVQGSGGPDTVTLREFGQPNKEKYLLTRLAVPGSQLRVVIPQAGDFGGPSNAQRLVIFILGGLMLAFGLIRRQTMLRNPAKFKPDPEALSVATQRAPDDGGKGSERVRLPEPGPASRRPPTGADDTKPGPTEDRPATPPPPPAADGSSAEHEIPAMPAMRSGKDGEDAAPLSVMPAMEDADFGAPDEPEDAEPREEIDLAELHYELEQRQRMRNQNSATPVELSREIFRAYDIRGVVGKTLDAGVARQVGQAVGSLALAREASPVVVGRDGRHSGPELVDGIVDGLTAAGCDVIDVGAVPTGALYYAAYELGAGSGLMVTGSHNPPDYNGFKVMIGGETLSGEAITGLYDAIAAGDLRIGKGEVTGEEVLNRYRERIAGDIQLKRPLKVVADCGNGIGGICAAQVLRAIGAEVLPLFDDVDGDFPNHHPDPSEPENLEDLIGSVQAMEADIGVAFDGDADRLGVITPSGKIVYADRTMMLFAQDVLKRNPGATIIYDVKCTGHLAKVISEAGGNPEMWKTGHSLIKNRMREIDSPFAGEMSGHFFFKDRWYGFDCGIYSAARLLEILASDERAPEEVLAELPDSVSTPELKVHMQEGENHVFIEAFQGKAKFPDATVSTIDGVRADFQGGWGLVRASNTTPVLVLRFDADDEATLTQIQEAFRAQLLAIRGDLELPF